MKILRAFGATVAGVILAGTSWAQIGTTQLGVSGVNSNAGQPTGTGTVYPGATPIYNQVPYGATVPKVVPASCVPVPQSVNVDPSITEIRITFDQAMDTALFYWQMPVGAADFPRVTRDPYWTNSNRTVVLSVQLTDNTTYRIPLNVGTTTFRSALGVYLEPGYFTFQTRDRRSGSEAPNKFLRNTNTAVGANRMRTTVTPVPTVASGYAVSPYYTPATGYYVPGTGQTAAGQAAVIGTTPIINSAGVGRGSTVQSNTTNHNNALRQRAGLGTPTPTPTPSGGGVGLKTIR